MDFMLVQGNDWFMVPFGSRSHPRQVDQLPGPRRFGEWTLVGRADAAGAPGGRLDHVLHAAPRAARPGSRNSSSSPGALRSTLDGPDLEEVRFVRDEQANH